MQSSESYKLFDDDVIVIQYKTDVPITKQNEYQSNWHGEFSCHHNH